MVTYVVSGGIVGTVRGPLHLECYSRHDFDRTGSRTHRRDIQRRSEVQVTIVLPSNFNRYLSHKYGVFKRLRCVTPKRGLQFVDNRVVNQKMNCFIR